MIKTSTHFTNFCNKEKQKNLSLFINEYRRISSLILDEIWENGYDWEDKNGKHRFSIQENKLYFPSFIDYKLFDLNTFLTARALSSLTTQLCGEIKAEVEKQRKRLFQFDKMKKEGKSKSRMKQLIKKIKQNIPQKPNCSNINPELSSKCLDWKLTEGEFDGFLRLKSITKDKMEIKIPVKFHRHSNKLKSKGGIQMNSYLISKNKINIRWNIPELSKKKEGKVIGFDQGKKDIISSSDKQVTPKKCIHGHSLDSILLDMSTKKKGSNSFRRSQEHRKNFINWSINQLNLKNVKEVRLEKIWNIGYKSRTNRIMSHWTNTLIRDKVESVCEDNGVRLVHQSPTYRSQRCSECGVVCKSNRKGKIYSCKFCLQEKDADLNASLNHIIDLPEIPWHLQKLNLNRKGFYWLESGLFDLSGTSLESVPHVEVSNV